MSAGTISRATLLLSLLLQVELPSISVALKVILQVIQTTHGVPRCSVTSARVLKLGTMGQANPLYQTMGTLLSCIWEWSQTTSLQWLPLGGKLAHSASCHFPNLWVTHGYSPQPVVASREFISDHIHPETFHFFYSSFYDASTS